MSDDEVYETPDELFAHLDKVWAEYPAWKRVWYRTRQQLSGLHPKHVQRAFQRRYQRARYGVSAPDTWNLHSYLTTVIDRGIQHLRDRELGYPARLDSWEEWEEILTKIQDGMRRSREITWSLKDSERDEAQAEFDAAMELLHEWWFDLWD